MSELTADIEGEPPYFSRSTRAGSVTHYHLFADCRELTDSNVRERPARYLQWHDLSLCKRCADRAD